MIQTIKIGPMAFTVSEVEGLIAGHETAWGHLKIDNAEIQVEKSLSNSPKQATLLHEVIHVILDFAGCKEAAKSEDIVGALSYGLLQVLRDNPEFTKGLLSDEP